MKRNNSASNQVSLHESLPLPDETKKIKLDTTNENLLNNSNLTFTSGYVISCKESIMARSCVTRTG